MLSNIRELQPGFFEEAPGWIGTMADWLQLGVQVVSAVTQASAAAVLVTCPQWQHLWRGEPRVLHGRLCVHKQAVGSSGFVCLGELLEQTTHSKMYVLTLDHSVGGPSGIEYGDHVCQDSCALDRN